MIRFSSKTVVFYIIFLIDFFYKKKKRGGGRKFFYKKDDKIRNNQRAKELFFQKFFDKIIIREKKSKEWNASCGYELRGRERKKLVDYRPLFSATIGYETGRRKLPLRFQISIIKLDGIVHRRNRKTMNLRHILRLPPSLSLSFAPGRTMKHSSIHLRAPFFPKCLPTFSEIFTHLRVRFIWSFTIMVEMSWRWIFRKFAYLFHFPYEIIHKLFEYFHVNQTSNRWKRPRRIPPRRVFSSAWKCQPGFHFQLDIHKQDRQDEARTILNSAPRKAWRRRGVVTILRHRGGWRPTMRTRDRVAWEDRVRVNRTATMGDIRWREVNLLGGLLIGD